jgi:hypothetical protein
VMGQYNTACSRVSRCIFFECSAQRMSSSSIGGMEMTDELSAALEQLKSGDHKIGAAFIGPSGQTFIIVDDIAIKPADAIRLANGDVTLEELKYPD